MLILLILASGCNQADQGGSKDNDEEKIIVDTDRENKLTFSRAYLYDKVLGLLLGSAIGDAMGAPTEMWTRDQMQIEYGFIDNLDTMVRNPSPEGTWEFNLPAGGTTDDTRWKALLIEFSLNQPGRLSAIDWASFITKTYQSQIEALKNTDAFEPEPFEIEARKMAWLQEWAMVAKPYQEQDIDAYLSNLHRFYGGEMTCAGMLYTPAIGGQFPGNPEEAYRQAFDLSIFDLGYARDLSALTAAMVAIAMSPEASLQSMLNVFRDIDPEGFFKSRLVGRSAYRIYRDALYVMHEAEQESIIENKKLPEAWQPLLKRYDSLELFKMKKAFELLDEKNEVLPFHPGEIMLINLVALMYGNLDFQKTMEFVVNYGRDNDTVAAVTGAILGAYLGASALPEKLKTQVLKTNIEKLDLDLERIAQNLTTAIWDRSAGDNKG